MILALQAPLLSARRVREGNYLVEVHADTALPVLAEVWEVSVSARIALLIWGFGVGAYGCAGSVGCA
jgi:hypothetical protein